MNARNAAGKVTVAVLLGLAGQLRGESVHPFGGHFWGAGMNVDILSHRTGWVVEANVTHGGAMPDVTNRYNRPTGEGMTILQRLDWKWEQTIPLDAPDQDAFAAQCANWANAIKGHCRTYSIGNEVEFFDVTPAIYAQCFTKVRNAIKAVQPDARVIIGHMNSVENQQATMQLLGDDGYDGVTAHASHVPGSLLDALDAELGTYRPDVGVYITEWGWVAGTNANAASAILSFYQDIGQSNATRLRQVYCACWFVYPLGIGWDSFALQGSPPDNVPFEQATALGTSVNHYADNPITMSNLTVDVSDSGMSLIVLWHTDVPSRTQIWWMPQGNSWGNVSWLDGNLVTVHQRSITGLSPSTVYEVTPTSTANDHGDAGGRRFRVRTGPWPSGVTQTGPGRVNITWNTDWPSDSVVEYGVTSALGSTISKPPLVTNHGVQLVDLPATTIYYRIRSSEPNPDAGGPRCYMRSPIRQFNVTLLYPGDMDGDTDVDLDDFGAFQRCLTGPGITQGDVACQGARMDPDDDVDGDDYLLFSGCLTGANISGDPDCTK